MGRRGEPEGVIDLRRLDLTPGAGARVEVPVVLEPITLGGQPYAPEPREVETRLDVGASGSGTGLRLRFHTTLHGACQRCLAPAAVQVAVDAREFQASGRTDADEPDDDLDCEYLAGPSRMDLDVAAWARDAMAEVLPMSVLCRDDCAGLCVRCGADLNAGPCSCSDDEPDPRWAALEQLRERLGGAADDPA